MRPGWRDGQHTGRHARGTSLPAGRLAGVVGMATAIACVIMLTPTAHGAARLATRLAAAVITLSRGATDAPTVLAEGRASTGTPAVGALFTVSAGQPGKHFCTASVVDSPVRDLVITAAHCLNRKAPSQVVFVPGYDDGQAPYGVWVITRVVVDNDWRATGDPNHDVAFLVVHRAGSSARIQDLTGGVQLGTGWNARVRVNVVGYPNATGRPITCSGESKPFGTHEMEFDCGGYTDGTSGGPFLAQVGPGPGGETVIGVIGGYEEGGDFASVSYSPRFGRAVQALYRAAVALG
jgi:V8-like Glu-specific endopeptidase